MIYTVPHYYSRFRCMAAKCPDTCCAGWAVYDGNPYGKMKMAAASSLIIEELALALWIRQGGDLSFMDFVDVAHRFSREIEHSDHNKALLEAALVRRPEFSLEHMLCAVNSNNP